MQTMFVKPGKGCRPPVKPVKAGNISDDAYKQALATHTKAEKRYNALPEVKVRNPQTGEHIPAKGISAPRTSFWIRRLRDGDVIEAQAPAAKGDS